MKTGILLLVLLALAQVSYGIGHPHNLFAARKAMLEWKATHQRGKMVPGQFARQRESRVRRPYSYIFSPFFSQIPHVREKAWTRRVDFPVLSTTGLP